MARKLPDNITLKRSLSVPMTHDQLDANFDAVKQSLEDINLLINGVTTTSTAPQQLNSVAFSGDYTALTNLPTLFSGDYADLINKPTIIDPTVSINGLDTRLIAVEDNIRYGTAMPTASLPVITITPSQQDVGESNETTQRSITFTISATNGRANENMSWSISGTNIDTADFQSVTVDGVAEDPISLTGTLTSTASAHTIVIVTARDEATEQDEVFSLATSIVRGSDTISESRSVTIRDTSLNSVTKSVTYNPSVHTTGLFRYISDNSDESMWMQDFDINGLLITDTEKDVIKNTSVDYTDLINFGLTTSEIDTLKSVFVDEVAAYMNGLITTIFGSSSSNTVVLAKDGAYQAGVFDTTTREFLAPDSRKYIRDETATYTDVVYQEDFQLAELQADTLTEINAYDYATAFPTLTATQIADLKTLLIAMMDLVLPIARSTVNAMSTTIDLYGYRILTPNS